MVVPRCEVLPLNEVAAYLKAGNAPWATALGAEDRLATFKPGGAWHVRGGDPNTWISANLTNKDSRASD